MSFSAFLSGFTEDGFEMPAGHTGFHSDRTMPMIEAMMRPAAIVLLVGEPGAGKSFLAQQIADAVVSTQAAAVEVFRFAYPTHMSSDVEQVFGAVFPHLFEDSAEEPLGWLGDTFRAGVIAERVTREAQTISQKADPLFLLPAIDRYAPRAAAVLEHLIRQRVVRIIATAARVAGGASHMVRDPRVSHFSVAPLDLEESRNLIDSLLGNARLSEPTLRRWHDLTGGNRRALILVLMANDRAGMLRRHHGIAHVPLGEDVVPEEVVSELNETCTEAERTVLQQLAIAEPMTEPALLRMLDSHAMSSLLSRRLISSAHYAHGDAALHISRPILAAALRAHMSPVDRLTLTEQMYRALVADLNEHGLEPNSPHLVRIVKYGLDLERQLPHSWLVAAVAKLAIDAEPSLMLRVSLALATNYTTSDSVAAAIRSVSYASQLRDPAASAVAHKRIDEMVAEMCANPEAFREIPSTLRTRLRLTQVERLFVIGASMRAISHRLDAILETTDVDDLISHEAIASTRVRLEILDGNFVTDDTSEFAGRVSDDVRTEWVRAPARSVYALKLQQQGKIQEAIQVANDARNITMLGRRPLADTTELQSLLWFLGHWASGSSESAREALEQVVVDERGNAQTAAWLTGTSEIGWAMLAMQEARWRDAAGLVEMLLEEFSADDPFGAVPLLYAVLAQSLAAMGMREPVIIALQRAKEDRRGLSQALRGFRLCIALHAQLWLRLGDVSHEAHELADWAQQQNLAFVELQALYVAALVSAAEARGVRVRAAELARGVDPLIAEVVVSHIQKIADGADPSDVSTPEVRLLADLGLWMPLPRATSLSAREREVALLASLGYTSRFIAERFHLSERTVETHLAHVYAKLGVADRGELRTWFSADRRVR